MVRSRRKNRVTIRDVLSNGQILTVFFFRSRLNPNKADRIVEWPDTKIAFLWTIAIHIGDSMKDGRRWMDTDLKNRVNRVRQTGECGLEGMRKALQHVIDFCENMGEREEMHIYCDDKKRYRAYKYLMRFNGFADHGEWYCFRHPHWWHWTEDKFEG